MTRCGFIAIIGRPNVGKSTLINALISEKISIISDKPQTTRHKIRGIKTINDSQAVYIDTPGIHSYNKKKINQYMNKAAFSALRDIDLIIFIVEALTWTQEDALILDKLRKVKTPIILAINKIDLHPNKEVLLPYLDQISKRSNFDNIIPISAKNEIQVEKLQEIIFNLLPKGPHFFPVEQSTDSSMRFRIEEIIREKLTKELSKELPYALTVEIERLEQTDKQKIVYAIIWVERDSQKKIVIGKKGNILKKIGTKSRLELNKIFNCRFRLQLWVKVKSDWTNDRKSLQNFGYKN